MHQDEVYVVRVYRRDAKGISGVVESIGDARAQSFQTLAELVSILAKARRVKPRMKSTRGSAK